MDAREQAKAAITAELLRQAAELDGLNVEVDGSALELDGRVDLDALAAAVAGALAGGP